MAEEIKLDENITIRDAFKITGRDTKTTKNPKTRVGGGSVFFSGSAPIDINELGH